MLITLAFLAVFFVMVVFAICETVYGLILITYGILCHIVAAILSCIHYLIIFYRRIRRKLTSQKKPRRRTAFRQPTTAQKACAC